MPSGMAPRSVSVLGATGSVGLSTIDLLRRNRERFRVEALTAHRNTAGLAGLAREFGARFVAVGDVHCYDDLRRELSGSGIAVGAGPEALVEAAARPADWVMSAITGAAGLAPTLSAIERGAMVALANKEALVCAGAIVMAACRRTGATLLPVDSEHNAIHQVFDFDHADRIERLILTASGGPFRTRSRQEMAAATPEQALAHPNWSMGAKISIDSATMMNKGLELIEASHLFPVPEPAIEIVVHPESVIHSMVAYIDGSVLAQLGTPDMRTPIAYTLAWPERMAGPSAKLDFIQLKSLSFEAPDEQRFSALRVAREALRAGAAAPTVLNAANEVAVRGFLDRRIGFLDIVSVVEETLDRLVGRTARTLDEVHAVDEEARRTAETLMMAAA